MPSSPIPPLFSQLFISFLVSLLLFLVLSSPSSISASRNDINTSNATRRALSSTHPHQKCIHQHLSALLQLKRGFNLSLSHTNLSSWNTNHSDCCSWEGITCNTFTGHVVGLDLSNLVGMFDFESLFHLRSLQRLDLSANEFDGSPIPSGFGQLSNLTHLHLYFSNFYGQIPPDISRLTRLVSLDLSHNSLELNSSGMGQVFRNLSSLRELYLDGVNMSTVGSHWSRILPYALPNLRILSMQGCGLSGPIRPSLSRLHFLTHLDLSSNDFSSAVPQVIANFTSLTSLSLPRSGFHGEFPKDIFSLPKLQTMDISGNQFLTVYLPKFWTNSTIHQLMMSETQFHGNLANFLGNFKSLTYLDLSDCNILGPIPQSHLNLTQLVYLDLSNNNIQGPIPTFIFDLTQITVLRLSSNNFSGFMDLSLLRNLRNLEDLYLSHNHLSAVINTRNSSTSTYQSCVNLSQLVHLDLSNNNIQGPIISQSCVNLSQLFQLDLSNNFFRGPIISQSRVNLSQLGDLDLSNNNFQGPIISQSRVNLSQHVDLDLSNNNFQGPIPTFIFDLTGLGYLRLSSNNFSGVIDLGSFQNLKNLAELDLSDNSFSSIINSRNHSHSSLNISQLFGLDLANNNIQGQIPRPIFELAQLTDLDLSSNNFSGVLDLGLFQNFKNLDSLDLSYNSLTVVNDARSYSTSISFPLSSLSLISCNITEFPDMLRNTKYMRALDLSCNRISGKIPGWIWAIGSGNLKYLNLSNNALEGLEGPFPHFSSSPLEELEGTHLSFSPMQILDLSTNVLKGSILIPPPTSVFFSLANNKLDGEVPSLICNTTFLWGSLDLSSNCFNGSIPQCLGEISDALVVLNLRKNAFRGPLLQKFKAGCLLETLDLSDNQLEGQMPKSLANCEQLTVLNLGNNRIQDAFPSQLANLSSLRVLVLRSNKFYGSIGRPSTSQAFFPQLQIIDVSFNNFSGSLPSNVFSAWKMMKDAGSASDFLGVDLPTGEYYPDRLILVSKGLKTEFPKILFALTVVDLSHNQFHGDIPSSIGPLKSLIVLNMSHNHFQGIIPPSLGNITELESLDLSQNSLRGEIPWQLTSLPFLAVLNLSQNQLTGSIPQGRQFSTFENDSFLGNPGLCGPPLSRKCVKDEAPPQPTQSDNRSELDMMWIGFGVGHAVGFGIFFWTMVLWRKARHAFFAFVDRVFLSIHIFAKRCGV